MRRRRGRSDRIRAGDLDHRIGLEVILVVVGMVGMGLTETDRRLQSGEGE